MALQNKKCTYIRNAEVKIKCIKIQDRLFKITEIKAKQLQIRTHIIKTMHLCFA
jgi:hypothetical protein